MRLPERVTLWTVLVIAGLVAAQYAYGRWQEGHHGPPPDTVYVTKLKAVAETTRVSVDRFRTRYIDTSRVDTLTDTIRVPVRELVTVFAQCQACADSLERAATIIRAKDDTIYRLRRELAQCQTAKRTWGALGFGAGVALACRE